MLLEKIKNTEKFFIFTQQKSTSRVLFCHKHSKLQRETKQRKLNAKSYMPHAEKYLYHRYKGKFVWLTCTFLYVLINMSIKASSKPS